MYPAVKPVFHDQFDCRFSSADAVVGLPGFHQ